MADVYAFMAPGMEEVECLAVVDVLIRAGLQVSLVSITEDREVTGSHGIAVKADCTFEETDLSGAAALFLPGGMPGMENLFGHAALLEELKRADERGVRIAAICAAPSILGRIGLLRGKRATCYPGFEKNLEGAASTGLGVVTDGNVTTARGLGYALDLGLELVSLLVSGEKAGEVKRAIQYDRDTDS